MFPLPFHARYIGTSGPFIVYGAICSVVGILALTLPETKGNKPPTSIAETRQLYSTGMMWRAGRTADGKKHTENAST